MKPGNHLIAVIDVRDKQGRVIGSKEVARYGGLLAKAHEEGLESITTELVQEPNTTNGSTAVVRAVVKTRRGQFSGLGDASPTSVRPGIVPHLIRMAETRAKARALRDAVNIGVVALEELGDLVDDELSYEGIVQPPTRELDPKSTTPPTRPVATSPPPQSVADRTPARSPASPSGEPTPPQGRTSDAGMSDAQRRYLFRLAGHAGVRPEDAKTWLEQRAGVASLKDLSKGQASRLIDALQNHAGSSNEEVAA